MKAHARTATIIAATLALLACALMGHDAWTAWLPPVLFVAGAGMGLLALGWIHALTGGGWGTLLLAPSRGATALLIVAVLAWLPLVWASPELLHWMHVAPAPAQRWFLSPAFFFVRTAACLVVMAAFAWLAWRGPATTRRSVLSLLLYAVVVTLLSVDWVMALVPEWHSAVLGMTLASSQMVSGLAFALIRLTSVRIAPPSQALLRDLGTLLLALTLLWGYFAFMDYLTAWMADQPSELAWYLPRTRTTWRWLGMAVVVLGFVVPVASLLSRALKASRRALRTAAAVALSGQACFLAWLVLPSLRMQGMRVGMADLLAWAGILVLAWTLFDAACARRAAWPLERA